jgi:hypothetical protein
VQTTGFQLNQIGQLITDLGKVPSDDPRGFCFGNSLSDSKQFEQRQQNKTKQQQKFYRYEHPEQRCSQAWFQPKKILNHNSKKEIQQSEGYKKNASPDHLIGVVLPDEAL